jgi:GAF domain-containing protein
MAPSSEQQRVDALASYGILDTDFEESYDRLTRLAGVLFDAPASAISLIDLTRQWLKSRTGEGPRETARGVAFCDHAIRQSGVLVVSDAAADPRFSANPWVTGEEGAVRFYAGAPLICPEGHALGTICVYDIKPRDFSADDRARLADLAGVVMDLLNTRRRAIESSRDLARLRAVIDGIIGKMRV